MSNEIHRFTVRIPKPIWHAIIVQKIKRDESTINALIVNILREQCGEIENLNDIILP